MKVLFIGAFGKVGQHFADQLKDHPQIKEKALIRNPEQVPFFEARGIETVLLDLASSSIETIAEAAKDVDTIIFSAGAGGKGLEKTIAVDLDGAVKAMEAAKQAGVKRFVMVSTFRNDREELLKQNSLQPYTIAKYYADEWLRTRTNLDWTILHPGGLTDDQGTGTVKAGKRNEFGSIPREDVAATLIAVLENDHSIGKEFEVIAGDTPISEAIATL
ncbi:SDR family oxidoreductase [Enterococcus sp.]|uniref:SDR family oxidoreductase n=1 Tax=Enterococcus sp. TaxID=35783 RepID=UPI0025C2B3A4|nr:SDR family oxidoreductase [Enterococcus sp.]